MSIFLATWMIVGIVGLFSCVCATFMALSEGENRVARLMALGCLLMPLWPVVLPIFLIIVAAGWFKWEE